MEKMLLAGEGYELTSSDESVVKIEGDTAKAVAIGDAVITAKSTEYDVEGTVTLSVVVPAKNITLSAEFSKINVGETSQISHTTKPTEASGTATITATDKITGISDTFDIKVIE